MKNPTSVTFWLLSIIAADAQVPPGQTAFPIPKIPFAPKHYVCYRAAAPINIDGKLNEVSWKKAAWTDSFTDIQGDAKPPPRYRTRVKMLWDDQYLYIGAELQEPNLWATLRQRDSVIFHDNDFEVFIDPNGSTQPYYETEINALGTVWDLLLRLPYRDADHVAVNAWNIRGLKVGVGLHGTLNDPTDVDGGWTVEAAFPWAVLGECAARGAPPKEGAQWRINFSRVEWHLIVRNSGYVQERNPSTGSILPEDNWVWSPQGLIDMHYPEMWGFVQFSDQAVGEGNDAFIWHPVEDAKWALREVYYAERRYYLKHHEFSASLPALGMKASSPAGYIWPPKVYATPNLFEASLASQDGHTTVHIRQDGLTWVSKKK
ncbi:MAG: carbohydrate-binding family 9-like protein [Verrucomicrobiota bacterium]|nr:carbohydrate-binding family 9-like protein [Verrucomicrobiota bacterium]